MPGFIDTVTTPVAFFPSPLPRGRGAGGEVLSSLGAVLRLATEQPLIPERVLENRYDLRVRRHDHGMVLRLGKLGRDDATFIA
jgi:hypothetical protein